MVYGRYSELVNGLTPLNLDFMIIYGMYNPIGIWVNVITPNPALPKPGIIVNKGNHPQMAARFWLVK
jgi:hypothetical protein